MRLPLNMVLSEEEHKHIILKGYAVNDNRIKQLGEVIRIMKRTKTELDSRQVLSMIEKYSSTLDLLDSYDHQNMTRPEGNRATYVLTYEECMDAVSYTHLLMRRWNTERQKCFLRRRTSLFLPWEAWSAPESM